jgi:hypothetical protein
MQDGAIKLIASVLTAGILGGVGLAIAVASGSAEATTHPLEDKVIIEASLAMSSSDQKQPQKQFRPPDPKDQTEKISRDEHDPVKTKKDDDKKKPDDKDPPLDLKNLPKHPGDEDLPTGPVVKPFNPGVKTNFDGLDSSTKGDPYFGALLRDMKFQPPEIARGDSEPVGCIELKPDGTIGDTKFETNTGDDLQTIAEAALKLLKDTRNKTPIPVPTQLLQFTSGFLCFKFHVKT